MIAKAIPPVGLLFALLAFGPGAAPFTPALGLAYLALPLALVDLYLGYRRTALVTAYWAAAALVAEPVAIRFLIRFDHSLLLLAAVGAAISGACLWHYARRARGPA